MTASTHGGRRAAVARGSSLRAARTPSRLPTQPAADKPLPRARRAGPAPQAVPAARRPTRCAGRPPDRTVTSDARTRGQR